MSSGSGNARILRSISFASDAAIGWSTCDIVAHPGPSKLDARFVSANIRAVVLGHLGLQNSLVGLSLVLIMFQLPFALFMMRNSFEMALPSVILFLVLQRHDVQGFTSGALRG